MNILEIIFGKKKEPKQLSKECLETRAKIKKKILQELIPKIQAIIELSNNEREQDIERKEIRSTIETIYRLHESEYEESHDKDYEKTIEIICIFSENLLTKTPEQMKKDLNSIQRLVSQIP